MNAFPLIIALLIVVINFIVAFKWGAMKIIAGGMAAAAALITLFGTASLVPYVAGDMLGVHLDWKIVLGAAVVLAFLVYVICRLIFGGILKVFFRHGGFLHDCSDGVIGGILSFFSSAVVIFFIFVCIRIAGTVQELNYLASISQPGIERATNKFPEWPRSSVWRSQLESIPFASEVFDRVEIFSRKENRNMAALLLLKKSAFINTFLKEREDTKDLVEEPRIEELSKNLDVLALIKEGDRVSLVLNPELRALAADGKLKSQLQEMDVEKTVTDLIDLIPEASMKGRE